MHHLPLLGAVAALCVASAHGQAPFYDHFGESSQTQLGYWIAPLGDIDNDGSADYISGAPFDGARRYARLFSGRHGTTIRDTVQPTSVLFYAHRVCGGGDVNADGVPDYGVATWFLGGQVWIHSGKDGSIIHTKNGSPSDTLGYDIRIISDIDGDKFDDFMAGSNFGGVNNTGYASIWSGKTGQVIRTHDGPVGFGSYGRVISSGGDMDGDGTDDYAVSAPGLSHAGRVDVFSGKTGKLIRSVQGGTSGHWFGISVDLTGDLDRDGFADLVVGALSGGPNNAGYVNIYAGKDGSLIRTLDGVANLDQFGFAAAWPATSTAMVSWISWWGRPKRTSTAARVAVRRSTTGFGCALARGRSNSASGTASKVETTSARPSRALETRPEMVSMTSPSVRLAMTRMPRTAAWLASIRVRMFR
jgi:hypothetical protein